MKLVIDLKKAGQGGAGNAPRTGRQRRLGYENSFDTAHTGLVGDDEASNKETRESTASRGGGTVEDDVEDIRQEDKAHAQDTGTTPKSIKKSLLDTVDIVKSLGHDIDDLVKAYMPHPDELEFLTACLGFSTQDVIKGRATITGRNRHLFTEWLIEKAQSPMRDLMK